MFTFLWGLMGMWPVPITWCLTKKQHKMRQMTGLLSALWRSWARDARCFCCPKWALAPSYTDWFWAGYPSSRQRKVDLVGELCPGWGGFCKAACFHRGADHPTLPPVPKDMCRSDLDAKPGRWSPWRIPFQAAPWTFDSKFCFLSELVVTSKHVNQGRTCRIQMRMKTWPKRCQEETITNWHLFALFPNLHSNDDHFSKSCATINLYCMPNWSFWGAVLQHITLVHIDKLGGAEDDDEEDADTTAASTAEAVLRDCKYNLHVTMMASNRCLKAWHFWYTWHGVDVFCYFSLDIFWQNVAYSYFHAVACPWKVKPISVVFDQSSMYGNREGHHSALVVTSQDKGNVFWKSQLWKAGVVTGVGMLPRNLFFAS